MLATLTLKANLFRLHADFHLLTIAICQHCHLQSNFTRQKRSLCRHNYTA